MEYVLVTGMVIGVVQFVRELEAKKYWSALTIVLAAGVGALAGFLNIEGIDVATGIVLGLAGSGAVTVAKSTNTGKA
jgi:hypothetical protein